MKHTPGPWKIFNVNPIGIGVESPARGVEGIFIAEIETDNPAKKRSAFKTPKNAMANARLISAAPDLLEALTTAHNLLHKYDVHLCKNTPSTCTLTSVVHSKITPALHVLSKAIKAATG